MTDFYNEAEFRKARKAHQCIYCAETIAAGEGYCSQTGNYDGRWYENKMHPECFADAFDGGDDEFTPYSNERPKELA